MSKANKAALNWLPKRKDGRKRYYNCNDDDIRSIYAKGYRKAEKNLELTWEDLKTLDDISDDVYAEYDVEILSMKKYYQEVLKRFKDFKERKGK